MRSFPPSTLMAALSACAIAAGSLSCFAAPAKLTLKQLRQQRKEMTNKRRRIIMNNDGCEVIYFPKNEKLTVDSFLAKRTTPLAGSEVDTIAFCPTSSGFSFFTHNTKVGTLFTRQGYDYGIQMKARNVAQELINLGTDCLQAVVEFGHKHNMEVFWSFRMNDTHDAAHNPKKPYLLYPPLKVEHPDWLVSDCKKRSPHGRWSSVNYALPQIRDLAFRFTEEVCKNYDVDGVELDYFRHLCYFKSTAFGGVASQEERDMMTGLMRRIRAMTEEVGMQRGRPILVSVRVPDSVGYCNDMGFDIERWMDEGLIDILITTGYFRLNPWEYTVDLAHKYGVRAYPCLSDSRLRGATRFHRGSTESYRGRAMNAWAAGADGIHLFNYFNPKAAIWNEIGDPAKLATMKKLYFVTVRDGDPRSFLRKGRTYRNVPMFGPSFQRTLIKGRPVDLDITIGDDVAKAQQDGYTPNVKLHLETPGLLRAEPLEVSFNGRRLPPGVLKKGWTDFSVPLDAVPRGTNRVQAAIVEDTLKPDEWNVVYAGGKKPAAPWFRDRGSVRTLEKLVDGALFIADRGTVSGDYHYWRYSWGADFDDETVIDARVKVVSGESYIIVTDTKTDERIGFFPDRLQLYFHRGITYKMDTTDDFHVYRVVLKGKDLKVYVDGKLAIDGTGKFDHRAMYNRNEIAFGAANSSAVGEAYWGYVKARTQGQALRDLVVSIDYKKK